MTTNSNPFHRVHERILGLTLETNEMIILFVAKNIKNDEIDFTTRYKAVQFIIETFFPKNRVILVPLYNTYIF